MKEHAWAKLNLTLDVLGRQSNGYHAMRMIMQSVEFGDDVCIDLRENGLFSIQTGQDFLPSDDRNLAMKAAKIFLAGSSYGADILLEKRTPVCAGLGGGSADAAAVLRALNKLTGAGKSLEELQKMGARVGSDVPFCIRGGTALAEGRGEILTSLPPLPDCAIVICKPAFSISTPVLFHRIDARKSRMRPDTAGMISALATGDLESAARRVYNVFEDVLDRRQEAVRAIQSELITLGALGSSMTGTGSAVFGIFSDAASAETAQQTLQAQYSSCWLTRPTGEIEI